MFKSELACSTTPCAVIHGFKKGWFARLSNIAKVQHTVDFQVVLNDSSARMQEHISPAGRAPRKPSWLKVRAPGGPRYADIKNRLRALKLHTVCEEARCPNMGECWESGTATVMILGDVCTRGCRFCAVKTGRPTTLDLQEPERVAEAIAHMGLDYVVITSVDRDDLDDGGAAIFAQTIRAVKARSPGILVEVLTPDFSGDTAAVQTVLDAEPDVFAHNVETIKRLQRRVRDKRCGYDQSLDVLGYAKRQRSLAASLTKTSIMVGVGETEAEVMEAMADLRKVGCDVVTFGQYLRPTAKHLAVDSFVMPEVFERYRVAALEMGFVYCASGPLVRSSYKAGEFFMKRHLEQMAP
jgi:lipoic acid synthetase